MTDALGEHCAGLAGWLPVARALTSQPDVDGTAGGGKPGSRPPCNPAAENAAMDAHEGVRRLEASLRLAVTGRTGRRRGGSDANTAAAIRAIEALGHGVAPDAAAQAARILERWSRQIRELPAVDDAEPWRRVAAACLHCGRGMLRLQARAGRVTCLAYGGCTDHDGNHPVGLVQHSVSGEPMVAWADGCIQFGAAEESEPIDGLVAP
jgi:hypothetical protein